MKPKLFNLIILLFTIPAISFAASSLQNLLKNILLFINSTLIPFLFGIAFLIFTINVIRYFVIGGSNDKGRENAKNLAIYSVAAFIFLIVFSGIVYILSTSTGLDKGVQPCPDYIYNVDPTKCP